MRKTLCSLVFATALAGCGENHVPAKKIGNPSPKSNIFDFVTKGGLSYYFFVDVYPNGVIVIDQLRRQRTPLRFYEAGELTHFFNVEPGDAFVLTDKVDKYTQLLKFEVYNSFQNELVFWDFAGRNIRVPYNTQSRRAALVLSGKTYRMIGDAAVPRRLGIDQNADLVLNGEQVPIVDYAGREIREEDFTR